MPHTFQTSPVDGKILHFGKCEKGVVEQVKGVNYALKGFLGPATWSSSDMVDSSKVSDDHYQECLDVKPGHSLYNCIIYLAPGDYHRFHSPVDWNIRFRRHFPGEALKQLNSIVCLCILTQMTHNMIPVELFSLTNQVNAPYWYIRLAQVDASLNLNLSLSSKFCCSKAFHKIAVI